MKRKFKLVILGLIMLAFSPLLIQSTNASGTLKPLVLNGKSIFYRGTTNPVMTPVEYIEKEEEFRGVWVATVYNLNMPVHTSEEQYKAAYEELIARVKSKNLNAILFQTRPTNDAFYESEYAPYSRYLTGAEGEDPGWDVMEYMVSYAHSQGIQFHAWMNPYRVATVNSPKEAYLASLDDDNFAKQNPELVIAGLGANVPYILDPGRPEVKAYIRNIVKELIQKYDVDGIHFDDYFYPYDGMLNSEDADTYANYNPKNLSLADWRRNNVDEAVRYVHSTIQTHNEANNKNVKFGISPFGIWRNKSIDPNGSNTAGTQSYDAQFADSRNWVKRGWVDYITPQIYWQFTNTAAPFADVASWWVETVRGTGVDLIVGHSITSGSLPSYEMAEQMNYLSQFPEVKGSVLYSAGLPGGGTDYLNKAVVNNLISSKWKTPATNVYDVFKQEIDAHYKSTLMQENYTIDESKNLDLIETLGDHEITWHSSHPNIISDTGVVKAPKFSEGDTTVTLTAMNQFSRVSTYEVTVKKSEKPDPPTYQITGEMVEGEYVEAITIEFFAPPGVDITYFFVGEKNSAEFPYTGPITFTNRGGYVFNAYATNENGRSETIRFNVKVNIPFEESNTTVVRDGKNVKYVETGKDIILPTYREKANDVRGVWVATVSNIDVPKYTSDSQYKAYLIDILDTVQSLNMNTVFFQVRSMNDAFYPSELAPYSTYIKGIPGQGLDWDILEFMVTEAHKRGIELHAWLNPYRIANAATGTKEEKLARLHVDNFARKNPSLVMEDNEGALILNPGEPAVRQYIYDVISELMENYDLDGIHMDDYFYTYAGHSAAHDVTTFNKYNPDGLSLADWRRSNVDKLVEEIFYLVEDFNEENDRNLKWGISPIGIWRSIENDPLGSYTGKYAASSYESQFADTRKWVKEGWLHYINPQVYWEFSREIAPYADIVKWWNDVAEGTNVKVLVGQGFYRMIENNTSMNNENEMIEQIRLNQRYNNVIGTIFFSYRTLKSTNSAVTGTLQRLEETYWTKQSGWSWNSDLLSPDTNEVIAAKALLQEKIDEINNYLINIKESEETNPYRLNLDELYSKHEYIQIISSAVENALNMIENRGYTRVQVEAETVSLTNSLTAFEKTVISGLGEEYSEEKHVLINNYAELLEDLENLVNSITPSNKEKEDLEIGLYAPIEIMDEISQYIVDAKALLEKDFISDQELTTYRFRLFELENELNAKKFLGTNETAINAKKAEFEQYLEEYEQTIKTYETSEELNPKKLSKGKKYISVSSLSVLNKAIREAKQIIENGKTFEEFDEGLKDLKAFEAEFETSNIIVGTKAGLSVGQKIAMYTSIGVLILAIAFVGVFFVAKKKKL